MNQPKTTSPRQRMQELLAIPERDRSDAEWDELNDLEITLASGNRQNGPDPNAQRRNTMQQQRPPGHPAPAGGGMPHGKKPFKKFHKRPHKQGNSR